MSKNMTVSVLCLAYNHEKYIRSTIEGVLQQKTDFNVELIINDDASTDNTVEIIREYAEKYPDIIKPIFQSENQWSKQIDIMDKFLCPKATGKYIALCEGDDYWIDPNKLQTQISFMEMHPDVSATVHSGKYIYESGKDRGDLFRAYSSERYVDIKDAISEWLFPTASIVYRNGLVPVGGVPFKGDAPCGDLPLILFLLVKGKVYYFDYVMSAYRLNSVSSASVHLRDGGIGIQELHMKKMMEFYRRFDEYTNYLYTEDVMNKITNLEFSFFLLTNNRKMLMSDKLKEMYKTLPLKTKISNIIGYKNPKLQELVHRVYLALVKTNKSSDSPIIMETIKDEGEK